MPVIRTPDERFNNLPGYPFEPHYVEIAGMRVHYLDEGKGDPVLMLHGEPSWSYLYRKMIPLVALQHRVVAPDLIGFGKSDKYTEFDEYSYHMHYDMMRGFIEALDLRNVSLVVQDWGGLIGLPLATEFSDRFARLVIMNTFLPDGYDPMNDAFLRWQAFSKKHPDMAVGRVIQGGTVTDLPPEVVAAYDAPFPDVNYKAGAAIFPSLVPSDPEMPGASEMGAAREKLKRWDKPALVMFSDSDPIMTGLDRYFRKIMPTAVEQPEIVIEGAAHFLQEDKGEEIAAQILAFMTRTGV